jgi:tetraacyldisaccharide 4'-kinase
MSFKERCDEFQDRFLRFVVDVIYDRRHGRGAEITAFFLTGLSYLFAMITRARFYLYQSQILRNRPLGCLVVVIGNLTVGGTGKTPVVERFARTLHDRGRKVAILSRGYKSRKEPGWKKAWRWLTHAEEPPPRIVSDGERVLLDSEEAGDEPFMLASNLPGVVVLVDKNRVKAGTYAIRKFGVDTLILDDGFQYLKLKGRLNLLLIDKTNPFGNQHLLPRGILREPVAHLRRASYIFLTKSDGQPDESLLEMIRSHNSAAEIIECSHTPQYLRYVGGGDPALPETEPLSFLADKCIASFSGIASPEGFETMLRHYGAEIRYNHRFLDHHRFNDVELNRIFNSAAEANLDCIVTTEKDAVRLPDGFESKLPVYFLRLEIEILSGAADFEEAASRICFPTLPKL